MCEENIAKRGCDFRDACMILKKKKETGREVRDPCMCSLSEINYWLMMLY